MMFLHQNEAETNPEAKKVFNRDKRKLQAVVAKGTEYQRKGSEQDLWFDGMVRCLFTYCFASRRYSRRTGL